MKLTVRFFLLILLSVNSGNAAENEFSVFSPDKEIKIIVAKEKTILQGISYSIYFEDEKIIAPSSLGLILKDTPVFNKSLEIIDHHIQTIDETYERLWGRNKIAKNHCTELIVNLAVKTEPIYKLNLIFRAYNDGVAFRYEIPEQQKIKEFKLIKELTEFNFKNDYTVWAAAFSKD
jgi:alpha-glucosidase